MFLGMMLYCYAYMRSSAFLPDFHEKMQIVNKYHLVDDSVLLQSFKMLLLVSALLIAYLVGFAWLSSVRARYVHFTNDKITKLSVVYRRIMIFMILVILSIMILCWLKFSLVDSYYVRQHGADQVRLLRALDIPNILSINYNMLIAEFVLMNLWILSGIHIVYLLIHLHVWKNSSFPCVKSSCADTNSSL